MKNGEMQRAPRRDVSVVSWRDKECPLLAGSFSGLPASFSQDGGQRYRSFGSADRRRGGSAIGRRTAQNLGAVRDSSDWWGPGRFIANLRATRTRSLKT